MKIHFDKSDVDAKPSLTAARLRDLLALVPMEWLGDVSEVRVSSSLVPTNSRWRPENASFNPYDGRLTIFARGHTPLQLVTPILSALAAHHQGFLRLRGGHLSASDTKKLAQIIDPHVEHIIRCLTTRSGERPTAVIPSLHPTFASP